MDRESILALASRHRIPLLLAPGALSLCVFAAALAIDLFSGNAAMPVFTLLKADPLYVAIATISGPLTVAALAFTLIQTIQDDWRRKRDDYLLEQFAGVRRVSPTLMERAIVVVIALCTLVVIVITCSDSAQQWYMSLF